MRFESIASGWKTLVATGGTAACLLVAGCGEEPATRLDDGGGTDATEITLEVDFGRILVRRETARTIDFPAAADGADGRWVLERVIGPIGVVLAPSDESGGAVAARVSVEPDREGRWSGWFVATRGSTSLFALVMGEAVLPGPIECLVLSPPSLAFEDSCKDEKLAVEIANRCDRPVEIASIDWPAAPYEIAVPPTLPAVLPAGDTMHVVIHHGGDASPPRTDRLGIHVTGGEAPLPLRLSVRDARVPRDHSDDLQSPIQPYDHLVFIDPSVLQAPWREDLVRYLEGVESGYAGDARFAFAHTVRHGTGPCPEGGTLLPIGPEGNPWIASTPRAPADWPAVLDGSCVPAGENQSLASLAEAFERLPVGGFPRLEADFLVHLVSGRDDASDAGTDWPEMIEPLLADRGAIFTLVVPGDDGACALHPTPRYSAFMDGIGSKWFMKRRSLCDTFGDPTWGPSRIDIPASREPVDVNGDGGIDEQDGLEFFVDGDQRPASRIRYDPSWRQFTVDYSSASGVLPGSRLAVHYLALDCH